MNKVLQVVGAVALSGAIAFGFVGCGESTKYSDEEYYSKLLTASQYVPQNDYTMIMDMTYEMPTGSSQGQMSTMKYSTNMLYTYDDSSNKFYSLAQEIQSMGNQSQSTKVENWVQQGDERFISYTKETEIANTGAESQTTSTYEAYEVSSDHAKMGLIMEAMEESTAMLETPATFEEFKASLGAMFDDMLGEYGAASDLDTKTKFSTKKDVHTLDVDVTMNIEMQGQTANASMNYVINYTDKMLEGAIVNMNIEVNDTKMISVAADVSVSDSFDSKNYVECPVSEFADTVVEDNYSVSFYVNLNNLTNCYGGGLQYKGNIVEKLINWSNNTGLSVGADIEWYYDKDYSQTVGAEDLAKSYNRTYYAKITPKADYAIIVYTGDNSGNIVATSSLGEYTFSNSYYTYKYNGEVVTSIMLEAGKVYLVDTVYNN